MGFESGSEENREENYKDDWDACERDAVTVSVYNRKSSTETRDCAAILKTLHDVRQRVQARIGKLPVSGRYHSLPWRLEEDYAVSRRVLGTGISGEVRMAVRKGDAASECTRYAVKAFKLAGIPASRRAELEAEVEVYLLVDHPHIVRLVDVYESELYLHLVMECMAGGEVVDRLNEVDRFSERDAAKGMYQMLLAVNYLHSLGIVHRDVKAENFLYAAHGSDRVKLVDFGLSSMWDKHQNMSKMCGTLCYVAPEVLAGSYTSQCDMWSLGVIAFMLLSGAAPFRGVGPNLMSAVAAGEYSFKDKVWRDVSVEAKDFVSCLLEVDPANRRNATAALQHNWIRRQTVRGQPDAFAVKSLRAFGNMSRFRRACMSLIALSLTTEEEDLFHKSFLCIDKDQDGMITFPELFATLRGSNPHGLSDVDDKDAGAKMADFGEMLRIFSALDGNGDWRVQYSDFLAAMVVTRIGSAAELGELDRAFIDSFNRLDFDRSGDISASDLQSVLNLDALEAAQFVADVDCQRRGSLSYDSYVRHILGSVPQQRSAL